MGATLIAHRIAHRAASALVLAVMLTASAWAAAADPAAAYYADPSRLAAMELAPPPLPASDRASDGETGFPKADAGISAYYRIPVPQGVDATDADAPLLNIMDVVIALTAPATDGDKKRAGPADIINLGLNFGIISIPMLGEPLASTPPPTTVNVYFDDQGWIIAYLPKDAPPAAIWRYSGSGDDANVALDDDFLARAIGLVAKSGADAADYSRPAGYYDWQNPECDAYVLFSNRIDGAAAHPVRFIIPSAIDAVQASAAVLITSHTEGGSADRAELRVDDAAVVSASRDAAQSQYNAVKFDLTIADGPVSQHTMAITSNAKISAAGVVMLLYDKP